jgi:hypothetical protein
LFEVTGAEWVLWYVFLVCVCLWLSSFFFFQSLAVKSTQTLIWRGLNKVNSKSSQGTLLTSWSPRLWICGSWVVHGYTSRMIEMGVKGKEVMKTYRTVTLESKTRAGYNWSYE